MDAKGSHLELLDVNSPRQATECLLSRSGHLEYGCCIAMCHAVAQHTSLCNDTNV